MADRSGRCDRVGASVAMSAPWNLFELLGLPPTERDPAKLRAAIEQRRRQWTEWKMGTANQRRLAEYGSGLLGEMKRVVEDPTELARHAEVAAKVAGDRRAEIEAQLRLMVKVFAASHEHYGPADVAEIHKQVGPDLVSEAEVIIALDAAKLVRELARPRVALRDRLSPQVMGRIRKDLDVVGKRDLYDLLGLPPGAPLATLSRAAMDLYRETQQRGTGDARTLAQSRLSGEARTYFSDEASRERYDAAREHEVFDHGDLAKALAAVTSDGVISPREVEVLVETGTRFGLNRETMLRLLREREASEPWRMVEGPPPRSSSPRTAPSSTAAASRPVTDVPRAPVEAPPSDPMTEPGSPSWRIGVGASAGLLMLLLGLWTFGRTEAPQVKYQMEREPSAPSAGVGPETREIAAPVVRPSEPPKLAPTMTVAPPADRAPREARDAPESPPSYRPAVEPPPSGSGRTQPATVVRVPQLAQKPGPPPSLSGATSSLVGRWRGKGPLGELAIQILSHDGTKLSGTVQHGPVMSQMTGTVSGAGDVSLSYAGEALRGRVSGATLSGDGWSVSR